MTIFSNILTEIHNNPKIKASGKSAVKQLYFWTVFITNLKLYIFCIFPYFFKQQREKLYQNFADSFITFILDSFFYPNILFQELKSEQWKKVLCRCLIYFYSICIFPITISMIFVFLASVNFAIVKNYLNWLLYPAKEKFEYQTLPILFQQRFHQLQTPLIRYNLSKACFNSSLKTEYNDLIIDQLFVSKQEKPCPKFDPYFDIDFDAKKYPSMENLVPKLSFRCYNNSTCSCQRQLFNKFRVLKNISVSHIPSKIRLFDLPLFHEISPKELVISNSILTANDLQLLSQLNLEFINLSLLFDGSNFENKMQEILVAVNGTPKIETHYDSFCDDESDFQVTMMEWLHNNDYVESINCKEKLYLSCFSYDKSET